MGQGMIGIVTWLLFGYAWFNPEGFGAWIHVILKAAQLQ